MEQIPLFINMEINTMHVRKKRTPSPEQLETEIPARQTQSRAVHLTPSKSHLLRTAADRHAAGVEQRDITCVILCRRFASYQDKKRWVTMWAWSFQLKYFHMSSAQLDDYCSSQVPQKTYCTFKRIVSEHS